MWTKILSIGEGYKYLLVKITNAILKRKLDSNSSLTTREGLYLYLLLLVNVVSRSTDPLTCVSVYKRKDRKRQLFKVHSYLRYSERFPSSN